MYADHICLYITMHCVMTVSTCILLELTTTESVQLTPQTAVIVGAVGGVVVLGVLLATSVIAAAVFIVKRRNKGTCTCIQCTE